MKINKAEFGEAFLCNYDDGPEKRQEQMDAAIADARAKLPEGMVFEIRAKRYPIDGGYMSDYGTGHITREQMAADWGIAWYVGFEGYRTPAEPLVMHSPHEGIPGDEYNSYILLARLEA